MSVTVMDAIAGDPRGVPEACSEAITGRTPVRGAPGTGVYTRGVTALLIALAIVVAAGPAMASNPAAALSLMSPKPLRPAKDFRVETDLSDKRMNNKIREAQLQKVPYVLVIGDKEMAAGAVAVRLRSGEDLGAKPVSEFIDTLDRVVKSRTQSLT